jgi:hypothetical protein
VYFSAISLQTNSFNEPSDTKDNYFVVVLIIAHQTKHEPSAQKPFYWHHKATSSEIKHTKKLKFSSIFSKEANRTGFTKQWFAETEK